MNIKIDDNNEIVFGLNNDNDISLEVGDTIDLGTSDYNDLDNKPSINGVELIGDVDSDDLGITVPTKTSELDNDSGYITSSDIPPIPSKTSDLVNDEGFISTETDPTVPAWAKASTKPTYTASEVGALPDDTVIPTVPTDVSAFNNDAGYLTSESDPTVPAWAKEENKPTYTASEVGALPDTTPRIFSGTSDTAAATTEKAVVCPEFKASDLKVGTMILVSFDNTNSGAVGSITLNVNGTGPKPIKRNNSGTIGNLDGAGYIKANSTYPFIYDGANWVTWYDTNTNTIGYTIRTNGLSLPMKSITYRYRILFTSSDGNYYVPANNSTSTNATASRTVCQDKIDPFGRIVYYGTTASVAAGSRPSASYQYQQYNGITLGYSFNRTGAALTLTTWKPVYIKCTPQTDGSAIIDATTPYVQDLPTTNDGFIYIFLGVATAATTIEMTIEHSVYYHDGTRIRLWT